MALKDLPQKTDKIVLTKEIEKIFIEKGNQNFPVKHNISTTTAYKEK